MVSEVGHLPETTHPHSDRSAALGGRHVSVDQSPQEVLSSRMSMRPPFGKDNPVQMTDCPSPLISAQALWTSP